MDRATLRSWLERYIQAWRTYDVQQIGSLFTDDAELRSNVFEEPIRGRDAIVASWFEDQDEPGGWRASYEPFAVDGDAAVAIGTSTYLAPDGSIDRVYHNAFVLRFDAEGRCRSFTEWYVLEPDSP